MTISATTQGLRMGVATSTSRPTVPFDGQVISETDTDSLKVYNGTSWTGVGGLVYLTGASFTTAASVSLPTSTFTSTYTNYLVMFSATSATNGQISFRFRTAGTDNSTSNYSYANLGRYSNGNDAAGQGNAQTSIIIGSVDTSLPTFVKLDIQNPQTADRTSTTGQIVWPGNTSTALATSYALGGIFNGTTSFDSMTLISTISMTGYYKVYGYSNS